MSARPERQSFRLRLLLSTLRLSIREILYMNLAGVPGFEPGLSVLETDVLTVDTIPLGTIADFRLPIGTKISVRALIDNRQLAIDNVITWFPYD